jgi:hypothetical protein
MAIILEELKTIKADDVDKNRLTYLAPTKRFSCYLPDELMWVRHFEDSETIVFRPMDGKEHKIKKEDLRFFHLVGR